MRGGATSASGETLVNSAALISVHTRKQQSHRMSGGPGDANDKPRTMTTASLFMEERIEKQRKKTGSG